MDRMDFIQGVTRTRVLENKLLSRAKTDRMIEAKDIEEVFKSLSETDYGNFVSSLKRAGDYEEVLSSELIRVYKMMRELSKDPVVVDILALKYDYHNLKVMVKENLLKKDLSGIYIPIGTTDINKIKEDFIDGNFKNITSEFRESIEAVSKDYEATGDPQRIDLIFDKYYAIHLYKMAAETKISLFIDYVRDMIDFINIKTSIRLKKQGKDTKFFEEIILPNGNIDEDVVLFTLNDNIEGIISKFKNSRISSGLIKGLESYKNTNRLSDLEKYMDNYLMELNKPSKYVNFGPEPIFSYLIAKETEIKVLRIIFVSKLNGISPDATRERVRDLYV